MKRYLSLFMFLVLGICTQAQVFNSSNEVIDFLEGEWIFTKGINGMNGNLYYADSFGVNLKQKIYRLKNSSDSVAISYFDNDVLSYCDVEAISYENFLWGSSNWALDNNSYISEIIRISNDEFRLSMNIYDGGTTFFERISSISSYTQQQTTCNENEVSVTSYNLLNMLGCDSSLITVNTILAISDTTFLNIYTLNLNEVGINYETFTNIYGCDSVVQSKIVYEDNVAVNEISALKLQVYPNPSSSLLNLKSELEIIDVKIVSIDGKLINNYSSFGQTIDISNLTKGVYFIQVSDGNEVFQSRFVKK